MNHDFDNAQDDKWALETFSPYAKMVPLSLAYYCEQAAERMRRAAWQSRRKNHFVASIERELAEETCAEAVKHYEWKD